jgi:hypothetical protein
MITSSIIFVVRLSDMLFAFSLKSCCYETGLSNEYCRLQGRSAEMCRSLGHVVADTPVDALTHARVHGRTTPGVPVHKDGGRAGGEGGGALWVEDRRVGGRRGSADGGGGAKSTVGGGSCFLAGLLLAPVRGQELTTDHRMVFEPERPGTDWGREGMCVCVCVCVCVCLHTHKHTHTCM